MNNKLLTVSIFVLSFSLIASALIYLGKPIGNVFAGVPIGNDYIATTTRSITGANNFSNLAVLDSDAGAVGEITIFGANTGTIVLYDATSTVTNTQWATTTIAQIPVSLAAGTYTLNARYTKGLLIEFSGNMPTSTISYR